MRRSLASLSLLAVVAACGGGSDDSAMRSMGASFDDGGANYPDIANTTSGATSPVTGTFVGLNGNVSTFSGTYTHNTGATAFTDGTITVNDPDGGTGLTGLQSGSTRVSVFVGDGLSNEMEFLTPVTITSPSGDGSGIIGLATEVADMPGSATAVYNGQSSINVAAGTSYGLNGNATVNANFGANRVDVTMNGFSGSGTPPFDTLKINNMQINASGFSGGNFSATSNGSTVNVLSGTQTLQSSGRFYGFDTANDIPAEVGGGFRVDGSNSNEFISGLYTGD